MQSSAEGPWIIVKLTDGEDLFPSLEAVALRHGLENGAVLWGIGMLQDFEIGFYAPSGYQRTSYEGRHELLALHGSIAMRADPTLHLHVAVGRPDQSVIGGHLFRAKACVVNEICVRRFDEIRMSRAFNPATGLRELVLEEPQAPAPKRTG